MIDHVGSTSATPPPTPPPLRRREGALVSSWSAYGNYNYGSLAAPVTTVAGACLHPTRGPLVTERRPRKIIMTLFRQLLVSPPATRFILFDSRSVGSGKVI